MKLLSILSFSTHDVACVAKLRQATMAGRRIFVACPHHEWNTYAKDATQKKSEAAKQGKTKNHESIINVVIVIVTLPAATLDSTIL